MKLYPVLLFPKEVIFYADLPKTPSLIVKFSPQQTQAKENRYV